MTTNEFVEKARMVHGTKYDYSFVEYVNAKTKVKIVCKIHGVFEQTPDKHLNGRCGCPSCAGNVRGSTESFIKKAEAVHGMTYDYSKVRYVNNKKPVCIVCHIHGEFLQSPDNHLNGKGCPHCASNVRSTTEDFIEKAIVVHGSHYDYSEVVYENSRTPVVILCKKHGSFQQVPYSHLSGSGCPVCGFEECRASRDEVSIHAKAVATLRKRYGVDNPMSIPGARMNQKARVSSDEVRMKRDATKRANDSFNTSLPEYRLGVLLESIFGSDDVFRNYVSESYPFRCDYYIKSRNLYIELNAHWSHGGHWYGEKDKNTVLDWKNRSKFYRNAANTFSVRDVLKRKAAERSRLNYVVFWKSDLSDAKYWVELGCPDGEDWRTEYSWILE